MTLLSTHILTKGNDETECFTTCLISLSSLTFIFYSDQISASQPEFRRFNKVDLDSTGDNEKDGDDGGIWFSQPVHPDHMLLCSQSPSTQTSQVHSWTTF